jgi:hypothetical protein
LKSTTINVLAVASILGSCSLAGGCGDGTEPAQRQPEAAKPGPDQTGHHSGKVIELGSGKAGPFAIRASRDEGAIKGGGDAPIDVWVESGPKVVAVRFWIGTEDAKGSVKARAEIEDPAQPNHYHTHAEVPATLPAGSRLWVEVEGDGGAKGTAGFDLRM